MQEEESKTTATEKVATAIMGSESKARVPIIDLSDESLKPGSEAWLLSCKEVRKAMEEYGCFLGLYDKVSSYLHDAIFEGAKRLFDLPTEIKIQNKSETPYHGYFGQNAFIPLYESLAIDSPTSLQGPQDFADLMFPDENNHRFCESVRSFSKAVKELDEMVTRMLFDSYGAAKDVCLSNIESSNHLLRFFTYRVPDSTEENLGLHSHTDLTFLSIIHQHRVNGLQVKSSNGEWVDIEPLPFSFVVMAGDALMAWSNERVPACNHRVIMAAEETRYSLGLFSFKKGTMSVPEEMVDDENPLKYKPFDNYDYLRYHKANLSRNTVFRIKDYCGL